MLSVPAVLAKAVVVRKLVITEEVRTGKVSVESANRAAVAGQGLLVRSRATFLGPPGRHSEERDEPQRLQDTSIVV